MLAEQTKWILDEGLQIPALAAFNADEVYEHLQKDPENEGIRTFLKGWLGGAWTQRVLGF